MIEKIRIFVSQFITSALVVFLATRTALKIIENTGLKSRLGNIGFNYESFESVATGLLLACLSALSMMFAIWLIKRPKTNYAKKKKKRKTARVKKIDMGTVKNIPTDR